MILQSSTFREPSPPEAFRWLRDGSLYSVRPELRGKSTYWYMRKMIAGKAKVLYLGGIGQLEAALLDNAADHIAAGGAS